MDQIKIGKFIKEKRKEKNITQSQLAEKLNITDRAISKWENGISMPDASIIKNLCDILDITINDLFCGEKVDQKEYDTKADKVILEMKNRIELQNKRLMFNEIIIGFMSSISFFILIFVSSYLIENNIARIILIVLSFIFFIIGVSVALKIETETGYYECRKCHHKYIPKYKDVYFAMHIGTTRYLKCPKCHMKSWNKKNYKEK